MHATRTVRTTVLTAVAVLTCASHAFATDAVTYFDDGVVHFEAPTGVVVDQTVVADARVLAARMTSAGGELAQQSFVALTIFDGGCTPTECRDRVLSGLRSTLGDALSLPSTLPSDLTSPLEFAVSYGGATAACVLRVLDDGSGGVVVSYAQFDSGEDARALQDLATSVGLGPAPVQQSDEH